MLYMVTFTINTPQMLAYIPYMDPMGYGTPFPRRRNDLKDCAEAGVSPSTWTG